MDLIDLIGPIEDANPEPTASHKAILWGQDDLLARAVASFLEKKAWEVTQVSSHECIEHLIQETRRIAPDVVIFCQYKSDEHAVLPWRLINEQLCLKVVTIGMDSNLLHIYSKQDVVLKGATDLLSILESGQFSDCTTEKEVGHRKQNS